MITEWTPEYFLLRIGSGASEYADKFENINEIFEADRVINKYTLLVQIKRERCTCLHKKTYL